MVVIFGRCQLSSQCFLGWLTSLLRTWKQSSRAIITRCVCIVYPTSLMWPVGFRHTWNQLFSWKPRSIRRQKMWMHHTCNGHWPKSRQVLVHYLAHLSWNNCCCTNSEIICTYKLIDVLYDLQENQSPLLFKNPLYIKQCLSTFLPTQVKYNWSKNHYATDTPLSQQVWLLEDWVTLLRNARGKIQFLADYET